MKITDQLILIPNVLQARQGKMNNSTQAAQTTWHNRKTVEYEEHLGEECEGEEGVEGVEGAASKASPTPPLGHFFESWEAIIDSGGFHFTVCLFQNNIVPL